MNDQNETAQLRFLEETAIRLRQNGFMVEPIEDHHLPVCWEKGRLCRVSGKGSVLYRQENVDNIRAQDALQTVIDTAKMTSEYMAILETAPRLKATIERSAVGHDALAAEARHVIGQQQERRAVFQQLPLKQLIVLIACPEGGKFFTQVRVGLDPIEHSSAPVGDNRFLFGFFSRVAFQPVFDKVFIAAAVGAGINDDELRVFKVRTGADELVHCLLIIPVKPANRYQGNTV